MKILGTLFRLLCALVVLLAVALYLDGPLQASLLDYLAAFTPEHIQALADADSWLAIAAGALLLLTLCCGLKLGWNIVYALATIAFFTEAAVLVLGAELAMPTAIRGLGWEQAVGSLALDYPVPTLMIPALCIIGCLCASAPVRIAWTSLLSCALCYGCAELLYYGVQSWQAMPEPFMPQVLEKVQLFPWSMAALPAVFFVQYSLFMAMFEAFIPRKKKVKSTKKDAKTEDAEEEPKPEKQVIKLPAAASTVPVTPTAKPLVVAKKPVIHKKSPISPTADEAKQETPKPEAPAEPEKPEKPAEPEKPAAPAEADTPAESGKPEEAAAPKADAPAEEAPNAPAEEDKLPAAIPSVPLPPTPNAAS